MIDCRQEKAVGYKDGVAFELTVVTVDGKPVEVSTANAFAQMARAAAGDGVEIKVVSGFRTMDEQEYFWGCYQSGECNNGNLAAKPGYSNHQSGHALDLNTAAPGVSAWMQAHAADYGFANTVPSEPWHWEWWGGGPPAPACVDRADPPVVLEIRGRTVAGLLLGLAAVAVWRLTR